MNKFFWFVVISGFCGGSVYPLIKIAREYGIPTFAYIFWESLFIILMICIYAAIRKHEVFKIEDWKYYIFCGLTNILIPQFIAFFVAKNVPVTIVSIFNILTPLFVYALLLLLFKERFLVHKGIALLIGFIGASLLLIPDAHTSGAISSAFWIAAGLLLPLDYA